MNVLVTSTTYDTNTIRWSRKLRAAYSIYTAPHCSVRQYNLKHSEVRIKTKTTKKNKRSVNASKLKRNSIKKRKEYSKKFFGSCKVKENKK